MSRTPIDRVYFVNSSWATHRVVEFEGGEQDISEEEDTDDDNATSDMNSYMYPPPTRLTLSVSLNRSDGTEHEPPSGLDQTFTSDTLLMGRSQRSSTSSAKKD